MRERLTRAAGVAAGLALVGLLATACASVVDGQGSSRLTAGPQPTGFPSSSSSAITETPPAPPPSSTPTGAESPTGEPSVSSSSVPPAGALSCPRVKDVQAHLSWTCITTGMTSDSGAGPWPNDFSRELEPSTGWSVNNGSGLSGPLGGETAAGIIRRVRNLSVAHGAYGESKPTVKTLSTKTITVHGVKATVVNSEFVLNQKTIEQLHTKVRVEKSWIAAFDIGHGKISLWYVSIPDIDKKLWAKVPSIIKGIRVT